MRAALIATALLAGVAGAQEPGQRAPDFACGDWVNAGSNPTLASLKGKLVLLEFWFST